MKLGARRLLVAAGIGVAILVVVVVIVNVRQAQDRRSYQQTELTLMGDGLLLEVYRRNHGGYPNPGYDGSLEHLPSGAKLTDLSVSLDARYTWNLTDGWGEPLQYLASADGQHYALISMGSDSRYDADTTVDFRTAPSVRIETYRDDVVFQDGSFRRWWGGWCCNPTYQEESLEDLKTKVFEGQLG